MTSTRHKHPTSTQRFILRMALANGGRYIAHIYEHVRIARRMVRRGWLEELPNPTADGGTAFDITERGMKAFKESKAK